jgi:hypothetical protein
MQCINVKTITLDHIIVTIPSDTIVALDIGFAVVIYLEALLIPTPMK